MPCHDPDSAASASVPHTWSPSRKHSNWMADLALRQAVEVTKTLGLTDCLSRLQLQGGGLQKVLKPFVHLQGFSSKE